MSYFKKIYIVTGKSGAGIGTAIKNLEDFGMYTIDNLPINMIEPVLQAMVKEEIEPGANLVLGLRFRSLEQAKHFNYFIDLIKKYGNVETIFLTAERDVLLERYAINRRRHPFVNAGNEIQAAILAEDKILDAVKNAASSVIDTSYLSPVQLLDELEKLYVSEDFARKLHVNITSFGFKNGLLKIVETLFDVRFLKNPYFVPGLRSLTGLDEKVKKYFAADAKVEELLEKMHDWVQWTLQENFKDGKHHYRIGIGCTGGQHRSVYVAEAIGKRLSASLKDMCVFHVNHRDLI